MNKPTLEDFLDNPYEAMRLGYFPDFMSCLALKADGLSIESMCAIKDDFFKLIREEVILFPLHLLVFSLYLILVITTPLLFPLYAIMYWFNATRKFKKYHKKQKDKPKLMIEGVEK